MFTRNQVAETKKILVLEVENNQAIPKKKSIIHWVDYFLCSMWIFFMIFIGIGVSSANTSVDKYVDSIAGISRIHSVKFLKESANKAKLVFFGHVKGEAALATTALQVAQLSFDKIIQVAIVAFVRALLTTVLNFLKTLLNKLKEARNQIAKLFNISGPIKNLFNLLNGRFNVCQKAENFVNSIFTSRKYQTPLDLAFENIYAERSVSSLLNNPVDMIFGGGKILNFAFDNIQVDAQSKTPQQRRLDAISRDEAYLRENINKINPNAEGCYFSLSNTKEQPTSSNSVKDTVNRSIYSMVDSCSVSSCFETTEQDVLLSATTSLIVQNSIFYVPQNKEVTDDNSQSLKVFNDFNTQYNPSKEIQTLQIKNDISSIVSSSADEAKKKEPVGGNNESNTLAVAKAGDIKVDSSGGFRNADEKGLCGVLDAGTGSLTSRGKELAAQVEGSGSRTPEADLALQLATGTSSENSKTICPVVVQGASVDAEVTSQAQSAIQQASSGGGGGTNLTDAIKSLLNTFLQNVANLLIDTLFSFVNAITSGFCSNFAIDAICDSLTTTSKTWENNLRRDVSNVRINSTKYNSFYEYYSGEDKLIGSTEEEIPENVFTNNTIK